MKTIIENATDLSHSIYEDFMQVDIGENTITLLREYLGDTIETIIPIDGIDATNYSLVENVTPPKDWARNKYLYADSEWVLNPDWIEPVDEDPEV